MVGALVPCPPRKARHTSPRGTPFARVRGAFWLHGGSPARDGALSPCPTFRGKMNITAGAVLRAIGQLPEAQRETVLLVYGDGYSYAEAAAALVIPLGAG
jgi:DNA-directed RNA polymerase specialized sigma24 family protein